jgi:hypothetical protein
MLELTILYPQLGTGISHHKELVADFTDLFCEDDVRLFGSYDLL